VRVAVDLDGQAGFVAVEVDDEASDRMVTASLATPLLSSHQPESVMKKPWFLRGTVLFSGQGASSSPC
jgi:hypothetical protein